MLRRPHIIPTGPPFMPAPYVTEYKLPPHQAAQIIRQEYPEYYSTQQQLPQVTTTMQPRHMYPSEQVALAAPQRNGFPSREYREPYSQRYGYPPRENRESYYHDYPIRYPTQPYRYENMPFVNDITPINYDDIELRNRRYTWTTSRGIDDVQVNRDPYDPYYGHDWYHQSISRPQYDANAVYMPQRPRSPVYY